MSSRRGEGSAKNPLDLGHRNAPFATGSGKRGNLSEGYPTADGSGIDAKDRSYLADSKVLFHTPSLGQEGLCYLISADVQSMFNILEA